MQVLRELGLDRRLERIDEHAPIYFVQEGLKIRPLLLTYYSNDMKCRPEETRLMYATMKHLMLEAVAWKMWIHKITFFMFHQYGKMFETVI